MSNIKVYVTYFFYILTYKDLINTKMKPYGSFVIIIFAIHNSTQPNVGCSS